MNLYKFLKGMYKHSRFKGRNGLVWGSEYSKKIEQHHRESLEKYGVSYISRHESSTNQLICFYLDLTIKNSDFVEYESKPGNLTHIF